LFLLTTLTTVDHTENGVVTSTNPCALCCNVTVEHSMPFMNILFIAHNNRIMINQ